MENIKGQKERYCSGSQSGVRKALSRGPQKKFSVYNFRLNYKKKLFKFYTAILRKTSRLCATVHHR